MANLTENQKILLVAVTGGLLTGGSFLGVMWARGQIEDERGRVRRFICVHVEERLLRTDQDGGMPDPSAPKQQQTAQPERRDV